MPRGVKTCPGCQGEVKGPRTLVCPDCNYQFGVKVTRPSIAVRKAAAIAPSKSKSKLIEPEHEELRTNHVDATYQLRNSGFPTISRRYTFQRGGVNKVEREQLMEYIKNIPSVDPVDMPSQLVLA